MSSVAREIVNARVWGTWAPMQVTQYPFIRAWTQSSGIAPISRENLENLYQFLKQKMDEIGGVRAARDRLSINRRFGAGFFGPDRFITMDATICSYNDQNLLLMWPRFVDGIIAAEHRARNWEGLRSLNTGQIKRWMVDPPAYVPTQIESLDFSRLDLTGLPEEFYALRLTNLQCLNLSRNQITHLREDFGRNFRALRKLNVSRNKLRCLPGTFTSFWQNTLTQLCVHNNRLEALPANFGVGCQRLWSVTLVQERLLRLPSDFFRRFSWLTRVYTAPRIVKKTTLKPFLVVGAFLIISSLGLLFFRMRR